MIHFRTLGPVELSTGAGHPAGSVLSQPKRLAVLAYLVLAAPRGPQSRDTLCALFWPEKDDAHARNALNQALSFLRRSLGEELIVSRGDAVAVDLRRLDCDAIAFEDALESGRSADAAEIYSGELLEGFNVSDAPGFEWWLEERRRRLRDGAVRATSAAAREAEGNGDQEAAVAYARRALELSADDEVPLRALLGMLERQGNRTAALRAYEEHARRLRELYGGEPSAETQALLARIRDRDGAGVPASTAPEPDSAASPPITHPGDAAAARVAPGRRTFAAPVAAALVVLAVGSVAVAGWRGSVQEEVSDRPAATRVLVTALENRTGDASLDPLGQWAADWIIQGLQASGLGEVFDPATRYVLSKNSPADSLGLTGFMRTRLLAEGTQAGTLVWGAYRRASDSLYFDVAISGPSGERRHTLVVAGPAGEPAKLIQELRSRVAGALARELDGRISSLSITTSPPPNLAAYREYVDGLEFFAREEYGDALPYFLRAAAQDSSFLLPRFWAMFATHGTWQWEVRDSILATFVPIRDRLTPLDRYSLDYFFADVQQDQAAALRAAENAARLAPQSNWTYMVGVLNLNLHRPQLALDALDRLDPERGWVQNWGSYLLVRSEALHLLGRHHEVIDQHSRRHTGTSQRYASPVEPVRSLAALGMLDSLGAVLGRLGEDPTVPLARLVYLYQMAGLELRAHGHREESQRHLRQALEIVDRYPPELQQQLRWQRGSILYSLGEWAAFDREFVDEAGVPHFRIARLVIQHAARTRGRADAERRLREFLVANPVHPSQTWRELELRIGMEAGLGEREEAVRLLRDLFARGQVLPAELHLNPLFDPLRGYPPFEAILQGKG